MAGHRAVGVDHARAQPPADEALHGEGAERHERRRPAERPRQHRRQRSRATRRARPARSRVAGRRAPAPPGRPARRGARRRPPRRRARPGPRAGRGAAPAPARPPGARGRPRRRRARAARRRASPRPRSCARRRAARTASPGRRGRGRRRMGGGDRGSARRCGRPRPPAVEAREAALVEVDGALGPPAAAADAGVRHEQGHERGNRHHEPPRRQPPAAGQPPEQHRHQGDAEPDARDRLLPPGRVGGVGAVPIGAPPVLAGGRYVRIGHRPRASSSQRTSAVGRARADSPPAAACGTVRRSHGSRAGPPTWAASPPASFATPGRRR